MSVSQLDAVSAIVKVIVNTGYRRPDKVIVELSRLLRCLENVNWGVRGINVVVLELA